ncbi:hypothetical protein AB0H82_11060 [Streptomyces sp. NPDC050732]|uniref:hypothetical protein n=1 Tax=Streptomyces sp. NPDC050732 TaxID=3154632 RepID=UPI0034298B91
MIATTRGVRLVVAVVMVLTAAQSFGAVGQGHLVPTQPVVREGPIDQRADQSLRRVFLEADSNHLGDTLHGRAELTEERMDHRQSVERTTELHSAIEAGENPDALLLPLLCLAQLAPLAGRARAPGCSE